MKKFLFRILLIISILTAHFSCIEAQTPNFGRVDLTYAAEQSVQTVVHIKTVFKYRTSAWEDFFSGSFWEDFFNFGAIGGREHEAMGAGSGVIISADGYIVTNNHVVADAVKVRVTLNDKREFDATVIGTDPDTDLALVKIDCDGLPYLTFGNSDSLRIGEWVLAVGNPFNLTSTVTAGIVSAKARTLDFFNEKNAIESYIQTDAAVNQGNSGGALVNTQGELVGINTAIASGDGYFTGYSFAIPSNTVRKIVSDLEMFGTVRRGMIGLNVMEIDFAMSQKMGLEAVKGLLITQIHRNSAAEEAGLQVDDVLLTVDGREINSVPEMREVLTLHSPGDNLNITFIRNQQPLTKTIVLK